MPFLLDFALRLCKVGKTEYHVLCPSLCRVYMSVLRVTKQTALVCNLLKKFCTFISLFCTFWNDFLLPSSLVLSQTIVGFADFSYSINKWNSGEMENFCYGAEETYVFSSNNIFRLGALKLPKKSIQAAFISLSGNCNRKVWCNLHKIEYGIKDFFEREVFKREFNVINGFLGECDVTQYCVINCYSLRLQGGPR